MSKGYNSPAGKELHRDRVSNVIGKEYFFSSKIQNKGRGFDGQNIK